MKNVFSLYLFDLLSFSSLLFPQFPDSQGKTKIGIFVSMPCNSKKLVSISRHFSFQNFVYKKWIGAKEKLKLTFFFLDNCIWFGCGKFSLLRWDYLSSAVNVLINCPKISDITKRHMFMISFKNNLFSKISYMCWLFWAIYQIKKAHGTSFYCSFLAYFIQKNVSYQITC